MVFIDGKKRHKSHVPPKLRRFLRTVAVRKGIRDICVAAVLAGNDAPPTRKVEDWNLNAALNSLLDEIGCRQYTVRYLGFSDWPHENGMVRQYNFWIEPESGEPVAKAGSRRKPESMR